MIHMAALLNTKVENSGFLAGLGDFGLSPVRYLFNGQTVRLTKEPFKVHRVASFHQDGSAHISRSDPTLHSSPTGMIKTVLAIVFLVPGLFFSLFKVISLLFASVRNDYHWAKYSITPIIRELGATDSPFESMEQLKAQLQVELEEDPAPTNALFIYGKNIEIDNNAEIVALNPMQVHLKGVTLKKTLDISKWRVQDDVDSKEETEQIVGRRRGWFTCKRYHLLFLNSPKTN